MELLHKGLNVLFFDIETTGFPSKENPVDIIEVWMKFIPNLGSNEPSSTLSQLYCAPMGLPNHITRLTGITKEMIEDAPHISTSLHAIQKGVDLADILVAHNAPFDIRCLEQAGIVFSGKEIYDTSTNSRRMLPEIPKHSLSIVCNHLGIGNENAHRALDDVDSMIKVYLEISDTSKRKHRWNYLKSKNTRITYIKK